MYTYCKRYGSYGKYRRKAVIDTGLKLCYTALKETANRRLTGYYEDLYLKEGENTFSVSPGFTVKIKPNWRCR